MSRVGVGSHPGLLLTYRRLTGLLFAARAILVVGVLALVASTTAADWTHLAGDPARSSTAQRAPRDLSSVRWITTADPNEQFVAQSTPIVAGGRVFVAARRFSGGLQTGNRLIAFDVSDGTRLWATDIEPDVLDSWSSPAVDVRNGTVLVASGNGLYAIDCADGTVRWETDLNRNVVNASPAVTSDLTVSGIPANRVLISDYDGFGSSARLYCINVDPNAPPHNPFAPGQVVWTLPIQRASGATPAYRDGIAYLASGDGLVTAINVLNPPADPNHPGQVAADWRQQIGGSGSANEGFYGGVSVTDTALLAAMYEFLGGQDSAASFKLDRATGDLIWCIASERTSSVPIATLGAVFVSGGIAGFGSAVKVQQFIDQGQTVEAGWSTTQLDPNLAIIIGGQTHQPALARGYLYAGTPPADGSFGPFTDLYILDTSLIPGNAGFIVDHYSGAGGSPALAYGRLFSIGSADLVAFDPSPVCAADIDGDGVVDVGDLGRILASFGDQRDMPSYDFDADTDLNGVIDLSDLGTVLGFLGQSCE